jgi:hypothetical protein
MGANFMVAEIVLSSVRFHHWLNIRLCACPGDSEIFTE